MLCLGLLEAAHLVVNEDWVTSRDNVAGGKSRLTERKYLMTKYSGRRCVNLLYLKNAKTLGRFW